MFEKLTYELTQSVCKNDGESLANLFSDNGVYHDYIYGSFKGKKNIKLMLNNYFHRDAKNFFWEMSDHIFRKDKGYAKYMFTFTSKIVAVIGATILVFSFDVLRFIKIHIYN